jgi:hypothetical protein
MTLLDGNVPARHKITDENILQRLWNKETRIKNTGIPRIATVPG